MIFVYWPIRDDDDDPGVVGVVGSENAVHLEVDDVLAHVVSSAVFAVTVVTDYTSGVELRRESEVVGTIKVVETARKELKMD